MGELPRERIRNVVIVGPPGAGKTSLVEALALRAGVIARKGRVEDGSTLSDRSPEERQHQFSIDLGVVALPWAGGRLTLLDTPGSSEFLATTALALEAAEFALVVVSAQASLGPELGLLWDLLDARGLPRAIFVNKCDRQPKDFDATLEALHRALSEHIDALELPLPEGGALAGVVDLVANAAFVERGSEEERREIPGELLVQEGLAREALLDEIVQEDDSLMERYLSGEVLSEDEMHEALARATELLHVTPVLCGSATADVGMHHLLDALMELAAPPELPATEEPRALVVSATIDQYLGRLAVLKNQGGRLRANTVLHGADGAEEKLHQLLIPFVPEPTPTEWLDPGDVAICVKLQAPVGTVLARRPEDAAKAAPGAQVTPGYTVAIVPEQPADDDKLAQAVFRAVQDDPGLRVEREPGTHRLLLTGVGATQVQLAAERIRRRAGVALRFEEPRTQYRETIAKPQRAEGRFKKQTGGHGQFGVAVIEVEPLARDAGFEFVDEIVGGAIPRNFIPAVEKGILEAMEQGGPHGNPVTDIRVRLVDGKYHSVDSSEMSFKVAGALALKEALAAAGTIVLEPISAVTVTVPAEQQGDILGYLSAKRGKIVRTSPSEDGSRVVIEAFVPAAELARFAPDLRAMTSGLGTFLARHDHYEQLPAHLVQD
jgi:elongation factor G